MSVIAGHMTQGSLEQDYIGAVKGAPETLKPMVMILRLRKENFDNSVLLAWLFSENPRGIAIALVLLLSSMCKNFDIL